MGKIMLGQRCLDNHCLMAISVATKIMTKANGITVLEV